MTRSHPRREDIPIKKLKFSFKKFNKFRYWKCLPAVADDALVAAVLVLPVGTGDGRIGTSRTDAVWVDIVSSRFAHGRSDLV